MQYSDYQLLYQRQLFDARRRQLARLGVALTLPSNEPPQPSLFSLSSSASSAAESSATSSTSVCIADAHHVSHMITLPSALEIPIMTASNSRSTTVDVDSAFDPETGLVIINCVARLKSGPVTSAAPMSVNLPVTAPVDVCVKTTTTSSFSATMPQATPGRMNVRPR